MEASGKPIQTKLSLLMQGVAWIITKPQKQNPVGHSLRRRSVCVAGRTDWGQEGWIHCGADSRGEDAADGWLS